MRHVRTLLAGLALLGVLGACGGEPEGIGFGGAPSPAPPVPSPALPAPIPDGPVAPAGAEALPVAQVDATALPEGYPRLVWTERGGTVLGAYGQEGGCTAVRAELAEQTSDVVRVKLIETVQSPGPCTMDLRFPPLTVPLDDPLDARTVILEAQQPESPSR